MATIWQKNMCLSKWQQFGKKNMGLSKWQQFGQKNMCLSKWQQFGKFTNNRLAATVTLFALTNSFTWNLNQSIP